MGDIISIPDIIILYMNKKVTRYYKSALLPLLSPITGQTAWGYRTSNTETSNELLDLKHRSSEIVVHSP